MTAVRGNRRELDIPNRCALLLTNNSTPIAEGFYIGGGAITEPTVELRLVF